MTADPSIDDLVARFNAAPEGESDAHWRSEVVLEIADHPDRAAGRTALETLLVETGLEGSKTTSLNGCIYPRMDWRSRAWKELLQGFWTDEEAFAFADDIALRHPSRKHRREAAGVVHAEMRSHPGWPPALFRYITEPENADLAPEVISSLAVASHFGLEAEVRPYLLRIARLEDPRLSCCAAGYLLRDHLADPEARSCAETLLLRHPLGFEGFVYDALAEGFPPSSKVLEIWLGVLEAAESADRLPRLPLPLVAFRFKTSKELRERLFRLAQVAVPPLVRASAIEALALHHDKDRRSLALLIDRLAKDPSGLVRSRAFDWLVAAYLSQERAQAALVRQLSTEADEETLGDMLKSCLGDGHIGLPRTWTGFWSERHRSCYLALNDFPLQLFPREDFQAFLQSEADRGANSFALRYLRRNLASLREHLDTCSSVWGVEYDAKTLAKWQRMVDRIEHLTEASHSVAVLRQRFREAGTLLDTDCDRERALLARQIGEHSDKPAARAVLEALLVDDPDEERDFDPCDSWRDEAWKFLFEELWTEAEGVAFASKVIAEDRDPKHRRQALKHMAAACRNGSLIRETILRCLDDQDLREAARLSFVNRFPGDPDSFPLWVELLRQHDLVLVNHPIEQLHKYFSHRADAREAVEAELLRVPLRKPEVYYRTYADTFPRDGQMQSVLTSAVEAGLLHAAEGYRNTSPYALATYMAYFGQAPEARDLVFRAAETCAGRGNSLTLEGLTWLALLFHEDPRTLDILRQRLLDDRGDRMRVRAFAGLLGRFAQREDVAVLLLDRVFEDGSAEVRKRLRDVMAGRGYEPTRQTYEFSRRQFIKQVGSEARLRNRILGQLESASTKEFGAWAQELFGLSAAVK